MPSSGPGGWWLLAAALVAPAVIDLPGGEGGVGLDELVYCAELQRVLVPAGRTGRLDLVDPLTGAVESIQGFAASARPTRGHGDGVTSADCGGGRLFTADRTRRTLAALDPVARRVVAEAALAGTPDYVRWVGPTREVWVTEPSRGGIETFRVEEGDPPRLVPSGWIAAAEGPESLVIDPARGRAYTNGWRTVTLAIDLGTHRITSRWVNGCRGARGIALDPARGLLFVGCEEGRAVGLDLARGGAVAGSARTGPGVDGIAYDPVRSHLYVPAAEGARLAVLGVAAAGSLQVLGSVPAPPGAHCAAADGRGQVYLCDPGGGRLRVEADPYPASAPAPAPP